ncbi:MAG: gluconate 2-dehydrogenase subunit 3 family protein [Acidobacteria bacterium]|nr:gluconate 2-dehydrogenase subunit 3 family protein [Acidobacteriota bacterium]
MSWSRRNFLRSALVSGVSLSIHPAIVLELLAQHRGPTFSSGQYRTLAALVDVIIPADVHPGASQAGVVFYVDQKLASDPLRANIYRQGLERLQLLAQQRHARRFEQLQGTEQVDLVKTIEKESFFAVVRQDTLEGFCRSPIGWASLNYPGHHAQPLGYPDYDKPYR